jgi:hypothetical protein
MGFKTRISQIVEWSRRLKDDYVYGPGRSSLPTLIAWLSLVMIAAGWGQSFRGQSLPILLGLGTFGIVAALGLDIRRRTRRLQRMRSDNAEQQLAQQQLTKRLTELVAVGTKTAEIRDVLQQITETHFQGAERRNERRVSSRIPVQIPVQLRSAVGDEGMDRQCLTAVMCEISAGSVCLLHQRPIDDRKVIVSFDLFDGQSISLTAEVQWSEHQVDGTYASGGKVVDVGTPASCTPREPQQLNEQLDLAVTSEA